MRFRSLHYAYFTICSTDYSDRCRYYWPQASVQEEVRRLLLKLVLRL